MLPPVESWITNDVRSRTAWTVSRRRPASRLGWWSASRMWMWIREAPAAWQATAVSTSSANVVGSWGQSPLAVSAPVGATAIRVPAVGTAAGARAHYRVPTEQSPASVGERIETSVELKDYIHVIRKRWLIIVSVMLVVVAGAALATALSPKIYEAQTQLFVSTSGSSDSNALLSGSNFTQQRVKSYADVITTPSVLDPVIETLQLNTTPAKLGDQITATVPLDTVLIEVAVTNTNPRVAAEVAVPNTNPRVAPAVAATAGKQFTKTVADLEHTTSGKSSPVKVTIVSAP